MFVYRAPVRHHNALIPPLIPEDLVEQMMVLAAERSLHLVVSAHDGPRLRLFHRRLESCQIDLPQRSLIDYGIHAHAVSLLIIHGEMLQAGTHTHTLHTIDMAFCHMPRQIGILGEILEVPAAQRASLDVISGSEQNAYFLRLALLAQCFSDPADQFFIPAVADAGCGRKAGGRHAVIDSKHIALPALLSQTVGTVRHHNGRYALVRDSLCMPEILS